MAGFEFALLGDMKSCLLTFLLIFTLGGAAHGATHSHVLTFKIWKHKKIDEAMSVVSELKREIRKMSNTKDQATEEDRQDLLHQKTQAELNLGVARELSANDYFVLYVAPQFKDNAEAMGQAAKNLSSKDVADILAAYQKRLEPGNSDGEPNLALEPPASPNLPNQPPSPL